MVRGGERVELDVPFPHPLHSCEVAQLSCDLLKAILHQRNQIPLQYDRLHEDAINLKKEMASELSADLGQTNGDVNLSRQHRKHLQDMRRKRKIRQKFAKKAAEFLDSGDALLAGLKSALETEAENVKALSVLIGATSMSSKTTYTINLPRHRALHRNQNFRPGAVLFRAFVTNSDIIRVTRSKVPVKNIFVYLERHSTNSTPSLSSHPGSGFIPSRQPTLRPVCTHIQINLLTPSSRQPDIYQQIPSLHHRYDSPADQAGAEEAYPFKKPSWQNKSSRLRFDSGPTLANTPGELNGTEDSLLPLDMNLCTPAAPSRATPGAADSADCTPVTSSCVPDTPVTSGYVRATPVASYSAANCSVEMELATPRASVPWQASVRPRLPSEDDPASDHRMEMCTPARGPTFVPSTPATTDSMELCTPYINRSTAAAPSYGDLSTPWTRIADTDGAGATRKSVRFLPVNDGSDRMMCSPDEDPILQPASIANKGEVGHASCPDTTTTWYCWSKPLKGLKDIGLP